MCKEAPLTAPPRWHGGKEPACQCRGHGFSPCARKIPGGGSGSPLQYSCLEYPMYRGAWWLQSMGSQRVGHNLSTHTHTYTHTHTHTNIPQVFFFLSLLHLPKSDPLGLLRQPHIQCILYPTTSMILKKKKSLPCISPIRILHLFLFILFFKIFISTWTTFKVFIEFVAVFFSVSCFAFLATRHVAS